MTKPRARPNIENDSKIELAYIGDIQRHRRYSFKMCNILVKTISKI